MSDQIPIKKTSPYTWEIPKGAVPGMRVPGIIYADEVTTICMPATPRSKA